MARRSKPLAELEIQSKRTSKRGTVKIPDIPEQTEQKTVKTRFKQASETKCAVCKKTDQVAKPYLSTMGSVHPKCHDDVVAERSQTDERIEANEEKAKKLGYPQCIICEKYAHLGDKTYVYSNCEIIDGKFEGAVHRSCFEKLMSIKT